MIGDLSRSLRAMLGQPGLPDGLSRAEVVFDRPTESFNPTQTSIDLFLYDIREDRDATGAAAGERAFACTYLVTAWPVGGPELALQEQELLTEVLQVLSSSPTIPVRFLQGALAGRVPPQVLVLHPDAVKNTSEFWTSLGNKLRVSLSVTVTIRVPAFATGAL